MPASLFPKSPWDSPSLLGQFLESPIKTLIRFLDFAFSLLRSSAPKPDNPPIRVICISDTHCHKASNIPDGDLLIHAGDLTNNGTPAELQAQIDWLNSLPHQHKVVIAGNHDTWLDPRSRQTLDMKDRDAKIRWRGIWYLQHSAVTLKFFDGRRQLRVYGAPQIPRCGPDHFAFQYDKGLDAWTETIPEDVDILVTHTPPKHHLDLPVALGCPYLLKEVWRTQPRVHVFGHIHAARSDTLGWLKGGREVVHWGDSERSFERAMNRPKGLLRETLDPRCWIDVARVTFHGVLGVLWDRAWGGASDATLMVNASLMYNNTGHLGNEAQVIVV